MRHTRAAGRTMLAAAALMALAGCQATATVEKAPAITSSTAAAPSSTEIAPSSGGAIEPTAWAVESLESVEQCSLFSTAMLADAGEPEIVSFDQVFFGSPNDGLAELSSADGSACSWTPTKALESKWRAFGLHIATVDDDGFDAASAFETFVSQAEGQVIGTTSYSSTALGAGTVYTLDAVTHGESVPADICHYVEGPHVVSMVREADGQCVAAMEQVLAVAKG